MHTIFCKKSNDLYGIKNNLFDIVLCSMMLMDCEDFEGTIREGVRVLKHSGKLFTSVFIIALTVIMKKELEVMAREKLLTEGRRYKIKTITICGSMKFAEQMKQIAWKLETKQGFSVLQCVYNDENEPINDKMLELLTLAHYNKIDMSDAVYIVDVDGYIGTAVQQEISYAKETGKELIFHSRQL